MFNREIERGTWFESHKLLAILTMLARLIKYDLDEIEIEEIKHSLVGTNNEKGQWSKYTFKGKDHTIVFKLAYDSEEPDMIHIVVTAKTMLKDKLEALFFFQDLFNELNPS